MSKDLTDLEIQSTAAMDLGIHVFEPGRSRSRNHTNGPLGALAPARVAPTYDNQAHSFRRHPCSADGHPCSGMRDSFKSFKNRNHTWGVDMVTISMVPGWLAAAPG